MSDFEGQVSRWQTPALAGGSGQLTAQNRNELIEQALREGFEEGRRQAMEQNQAGIDEQKARFEELFRAFEQPLGSLDSRLVSELSQLSVKIAELILKSELQTDPTVIERLTEEALSSVEQSESTRVLLNPSDLDFLRRAGLIARWNQVSFEGDDSLGQGAVLIRSASSSLDASLEARLQQVLHDLLGDD